MQEQQVINDIGGVFIYCTGPHWTPTSRETQHTPSLLQRILRVALNAFSFCASVYEDIPHIPAV